jgi:hypothetical protein
MTKIPVGETIRFAYAFTFGEIGTVIGLVWIPVVLNAIAAFLVERTFGGATADPAQGLPPGFGFFVLYTVFAAFVVAMLATAITRQALGLRQGPAFAHVSVSAAELRVFGGLAGLYLLFFIFAMGIALATVVLGVLGSALVPAKPAGEAVGAALAGVAAVGGIGALIYAMVRLSFVMVSSAVVEGGFGLTRSWELTRGNFWRIVAVGAATAIPVTVLVFAINAAILGPEYIDSVVAMFRDQAHMAKYAAIQSQLTAAKTPLLLGVSLVLAPVTYGLAFAPAAFAYRILTGKVTAPE